MKPAQQPAARTKAIAAIMKEVERLAGNGIGAQDILMALLDRTAVELAANAAEGKEALTIEAATSALKKLFWQASKDADVRSRRFVAGLMTARAAAQRADGEAA